jgi:hypothetical protein
MTLQIMERVGKRLIGAVGILVHLSLLSIKLTRWLCQIYLKSSYAS